MNNDHCIDVCNRLLRGEQSAVAAYSQAIISFEGTKTPPAELRDILDDHRKAVLTLTENVRSMGGEPAHDSGAWGSFATTVQGAADTLGDKPALVSLQTGEKAGKADYEAALEDAEVMPKCKTMIRSDLLLAVERHIRLLDDLQAVIA